MYQSLPTDLESNAHESAELGTQEISPYALAMLLRMTTRPLVLVTIRDGETPFDITCGVRVSSANQFNASTDLLHEPPLTLTNEDITALGHATQSAPRLTPSYRHFLVIKPLKTTPKPPAETVQTRSQSSLPFQQRHPMNTTLGSPEHCCTS